MYGRAQVEGFAGNSESSLVSVGVSTVAAASVSELATVYFPLATPRVGSVFRVVVRATADASEWAVYRAFPIADDTQRLVGGALVSDVAAVVRVSVPVGASDAASWTGAAGGGAGVWETSGTVRGFETEATGAGHLISRAAPVSYALGGARELTLLERAFASSGVPNASVATITYHFAGPQRVTALEVVEHYKGVTSVRACVRACAITSLCELVCACMSVVGACLGTCLHLLA